MAAPGYYRSPIDRPCFDLCPVCGRCDARRARPYAACTTTCSGHIDKEGAIDPHPDDLCRCREGIMQMVRIKDQKGRFIQYKWKKNPFTSGSVKSATKTEDERDYDAWLQTERNKRDDPNFDPLEAY